MAEKKTTEVAKVEQEKRELVAKDFTDGLVVKIMEKEKFGLTFPKDYNYTNEFMAAMLILQDTVDSNKQPVLQSCTRQSIENCLFEMVTSGLSMQKKQCYAVAYGGKLQCQKSVYGNTCIARRYGLKEIDAQVIYEGDNFSYHIENGRKVIDKHEQDFININNDRILGAYAIATMESGAVYVEIMNMAQIKQSWKQGFGYKEGGNGTHQKFTDQMAMKTVKNRLLKFINNTYGSMELNDLDTEDMPSYEERIVADVQNDIKQKANSCEFELEDDVCDVVEIVQEDKEISRETKEAPFM